MIAFLTALAVSLPGVGGGAIGREVGRTGADNAPYVLKTHCVRRRCKRLVVEPYDAYLEGVAYCESRRRWHIDGYFDGGLQFSPATWSRTGSRFVYAWQASELEQKYRAILWARLIGFNWHSTAGWPVCG